MKVSEIGEFGLIDLLTKMASRARGKQKSSDRQLIIGIGDDTAAWHGDTSIQLATVDSLIQDTHFSLDTASWEEIGWKSLAVNLSDIAAMGGLPGYALVSLALPYDTEVENVTALYQGMIELARQFDVAIIGGNVSSAPQLAVHVTVLGTAGNQERQILTRSAARPGDVVAVTGYLGAAAAGLEMLNKNLALEPGVTSALRKVFLTPCPRIAEGQLLVEHGVQAAIDISDGLLADLGHVCQASQVSACIQVDRVPVAPEVQANFGDHALELALAGGEDYELLFTGSSEIIDSVRKAAPCPVTVIGEIMAGKAGEVNLVDSNGEPVSLPSAGWNHFITG
jgi:thiamine-monophosphate kinase